MESSGNLSEMHHQRAVVSLGKKIFDEQFEEIEAIDLITTLNSRSGLNMNNSMQNMNFAPLEMTAASFDKLTAPKNKFELSSFTEHQSRVFRDDLALTNMEVTEGMDINFSNVQPLVDGDDLDEIEKDIGRVQSNNIICHGPFDMGNMSGYIEVDMNTTNVVMRDDNSEMSITNSIHIPKVDDLSKSISLDKKDLNKDWLIDKENIAINPYITPRETDNFAINNESDKVLVFDGKRLTVQSEKEDLNSNRPTMLPKPISCKDQRKMRTLNDNDDLPNFFDISEASSSEEIPHIVPTKVVKNNMSVVNDTRLQTILYDDGMDISITQALPTNIAVTDMSVEEKQRTIVFSKDTGNISITQVVPNSKIVSDNDTNISLTEALPSNILLNIEKKDSMIKNDIQDKRKIILNESNNDISMTEGLLDSILSANLKGERRQTIVFDNDMNMSMTQAVSYKILSQEQIEKRKSLALDDLIYSKSHTISSKLETMNTSLNPTKDIRRKTISMDDDVNMSITQAVSYKILSQEQIEPRKITAHEDHTHFKSHNISSKLEIVNNLPDSTLNVRRKTIASDEDGNMSMTQTIPNKIVTKEQIDKKKSLVHDDYNPHNSTSKSEIVNNNRRQTLLCDRDENMSMTQLMPNQIISRGQVENRTSGSKFEAINSLADSDENNENVTMALDDNGNMSITRAVCAKILLHEQIQEKENFAHANCSHTTKDTTNMNNLIDYGQDNRRQVLIPEGDGNISIIQANHTKLKDRSNIIHDNGQYRSKVNYNNSEFVSLNEIASSIQKNKRGTIVFDDNVGDISITQALPTHILNNFTTDFDKSIMSENIYEDNARNISKSKTLPSKGILRDNHAANESNICTSTANPFVSKAEKSEKSDKQEDLTNQQDNDLFTLITPCNMLNNNKSNMALIQERQNSFTSDTINNDNADKDVKSVRRRESNNVENNAGIYKEKDENTEKVYENNITNSSKINIECVKSEETKCDSLKHTTKMSVMNNQRVSRNEENDISMTNSQMKLTVIRNSPKKDIINSYEKKDGTISKSFRKHINITDYSLDNCPRTAVKPIPMELSNLQGKDLKTKENEIDSVVIDNMHQSIMVYQSLTSSASELKRTEQGDIKCEGTFHQSNIKSDSSTAKAEREGINSDTHIAKNMISETKISVSTTNKETIDIETADKPASILDELLDMSTSSMERGVDRKYSTVKVKTSYASVNSMRKSDDASNDSMFYITRDNDEEDQADLPSKDLKANDPSKRETSPLPMTYNEDQPQVLEDVQSQLNNSKSVSNDNSPPQNRYYEKVVSSDILAEKDKLKERLSVAGRSFKTADDTSDLLRLLSDLTDKKDTEPIEEQGEPAVIQEPSLIEKKIEFEPKRLSLAPKRQSIIISREDLLNNISMAHATLQKSRYELDLSDSIEDTQEESIEEPVHKKSIRISSEVVKALHFDDDTASESSIRSELKMSPLKKTAFSEPSNIREAKVNVIPTYLKDVSDNIKSLMSDLVKPIQDVMPFEVDKCDKDMKSNSTCSTQVQANLITSSQIDLESVVNSENPSLRQMNSTNALIYGIANSGNQAIDHALKSALKSSRPAEKYSDTDVGSVDDSFNELSVGKQTANRYIEDKVLIFDHNNPLNNVLLPPPALAEVHRYDPKIKCLPETSDSAQILIQDTDKEYNVERMEIETTHVGKQAGDACMKNPADTQSIGSNISKTMSVDESIDVKPIDVKDTEVNTMIVMKGTKQLLEASSSLTLVDDALTHPAFDINIDTNTSSQDDVSSKNLQSPMNTVFKNNIEENLHNTESDLESTNEKKEPVKARTKKRVYSPANVDKHKNCTLSNLDIRNTPVSKMLKISQSPVTKNNAIYFVNNDICEKPVKESVFKKSPVKLKHEKTSPKEPKNEKPGTSVTVQQLAAEYDMQLDVRNVVESQSSISDSVSKSNEGRSVDMISSFTSSKNFKACSDSASNTVSTVSESSKNSNIQCQLESENENLKKPIKVCDSVNVVAKIDMLPFMG